MSRAPGVSSSFRSGGTGRFRGYFTSISTALSLCLEITFERSWDDKTQSDALVPIITAQISFSAYRPEICTPGLSLSWAAFADVVPCSLRSGLLHGLWSAGLLPDGR